MKKLKLDPESLRVDAFETLPAGGRGTVAGEDADYTVTLVYCTGLKDYSCWEDCTTHDVGFSCHETCQSLTLYAPTCVHVCPREPVDPVPVPR